MTFMVRSRIALVAPSSSLVRRRKACLLTRSSRQERAIPDARGRLQGGLS